MYLSDFEHLFLFKKYSPLKFEVVRNRSKFCTFWSLQFSDLIFKIQPPSNHVAEFLGDQPTPSEIPWRKGNKTSVVKHKTVPKATVSGRTNKLVYLCNILSTANAQRIDIVTASTACVASKLSAAVHGSELPAQSKPLSWKP